MPEPAGVPDMSRASTALRIMLAVTASLWALPTLRFAERALGTRPVVHEAAGWAFLLVVLTGYAALWTFGLVGLVRQLAAVHAAVAARPRSLARAAVGWTVAGLGLLAVLSVFRDAVADWLATATHHLTSHEFVGYEMFGRTEDRDRHDAWIARWDSGRIAAIEAAFVLCCVAWTALAVRFGGRSGIRAAVRAVGGAGVLAWVFALSGDLTVLTYDVFFDGVLAGQVAALPIPFQLGFCGLVTVASVFLVAMIANRWILARRD